MSSITRSLKTNGARVETILDAPVKKDRLQIVLDESRGIQSEWARTCNAELIQVLIVKWAESKKGISFIKPVNALPRSIRNCEQKLRFTDTIDKLIVRTALAMSNPCIVSVDSDFWNPDKKIDGGQIGVSTAPMCQLLKGEGIELMTLDGLVTRLK